MAKKYLLGLVCLVLACQTLVAQWPNHYIYQTSIFDDTTYKYSFMDVLSTDTVVVMHRTGWSGPYIHDTIVGNYVMIAPPINDDMEDWGVISVNGQPRSCTERLWLHFIPHPHPMVTVTSNQCLIVNDTILGGSPEISIVNLDSNAVVAQYNIGNWDSDLPIQVCGLPSGNYLILFTEKLGYLEDKQTILVTIP